MATEAFAVSCLGSRLGFFHAGTPSFLVRQLAAGARRMPASSVFLAMPVLYGHDRFLVFSQAAALVAGMIALDFVVKRFAPRHRGNASVLSGVLGGVGSFAAASAFGEIPVAIVPLFVLAAAGGFWWSHRAWVAGPARRAVLIRATLYTLGLVAGFTVFAQQGFRTPWTERLLSPQARVLYEKHQVLLYGASEEDAKILTELFDRIPPELQNELLPIHVVHRWLFRRSGASAEAIYPPGSFVIASNRISNEIVLHELFHVFQRRRLSVQDFLDIHKSHKGHEDEFKRLLSTYAGLERVSAIDPGRGLSGIEAFPIAGEYWHRRPWQLLGIQEVSQSRAVRTVIEKVAKAQISPRQGGHYLRFYLPVEARHLHPKGYVDWPMNSRTPTFEELQDIFNQLIRVPLVGHAQTPQEKLLSHLHGWPVHGWGDLPLFGPEGAMFRRTEAYRVLENHYYWQATPPGVPPLINATIRLAAIRPSIREALRQAFPGSPDTHLEQRLNWGLTYFLAKDGQSFYEPAAMLPTRRFFERLFAGAGLSEHLRPAPPATPVGNDSMLSRSGALTGAQAAIADKEIARWSSWGGWHAEFALDRYWKELVGVAPYPLEKSFVRNGLLLLDPRELRRLGTGLGFRLFLQMETGRLTPAHRSPATVTGVSALRLFPYGGFSALETAWRELYGDAATAELRWFLAGLVAHERFATDAERLAARDRMFDAAGLHGKQRVRAMGLWDAGDALRLAKGVPTYAETMLKFLLETGDHGAAIRLMAYGGPIRPDPAEQIVFERTLKIATERLKDFPWSVRLQKPRRPHSLPLRRAA